MSTVISPDLAVNPSVPISGGDYAKQLDLAPKSYAAPVYKLRRFTQISGGTSLTLSTATTMSQFNIPGDKVWNLSKSYLQFDATFPAVNVNLSINSAFTDCLPLDSIQLQTASGQILANVQQAQVYSKIAQPLSLSLDEYNSRGPVYGDTGIGTGYPISQNMGCQPYKDDDNRTSTQLFPSRPSAAVIIDVTAGGDAADIPSRNTAAANHESGSDVLVNAPQTLISGAVDSGTAAGESVLVIRFKIPFKAFSGTILAVDRDLYFGQNLQLSIYYKPIANFGFSTAGVAGAASTAPVSLAFSNYFMWLQEDISENAMDIKAQVMSGGLAMLCPYVESSQLTTTAAAGTYTISSPLTPGMGVALKRVITVPVNGANTTKRTANSFNVNGVKWTQVQSTLDGKPIQDQFLVVNNCDVWNYLYNNIKNTPLGLSMRTFDQQAFFMDNFSDCDDGSQFNENDLKESGLTVQLPKTYEVTFVQALTASLALYQYRVWLRKLVIGPGGISWGV